MPRKINQCPAIGRSGRRDCGRSGQGRSPRGYSAVVDDAAASFADDGGLHPVVEDLVGNAANRLKGRARDELNDDELG
jgi:hypothetical protein